ncbi:hypothetical protein HQQ80_08240 [Microbacteriaceae bacterium VKM Ac-2855]|nr:hypothetical protein [Microbacteriaceae bacterium VKM Ac-2855]
MATPPTGNGPRGPERHSHHSEQAVDHPLVSPAETWPQAPEGSQQPAPAVVPATRTRVKKRRKRSARSKAKAAAKRGGRVVISVLAVVALVAVIVLIVNGGFFGI